MVSRRNIAAKNKIIQIGNIKTQANEITTCNMWSLAPWRADRLVTRKNIYVLSAPDPIKTTIARYR